MTEETQPYARRCSDCPTADDCRHAFGKYWPIRSDLGRGCHHPFPGYDRPSKPTISKTQQEKNHEY